ncbi:GABA-specific permease [Trichomonascus vanleenenianus]|uniref:GABA-specific permease n=1 Tax=Trichomonascus vanleenenianus TaxID=2268995 RepID=UPI003EC9F53C
MKTDQELLEHLGYEQELRREWTWVQNFGASFSLISVITGITTLFSYGLNTGGPAVIACGWLVVNFFTFAVGLAMAEVVSSVPTSGGPYHWAAVLSPPKYAAFAAWITGWFNLLGQIGVTTGVSFGCAQLISTLAATVNPDFVATPAKTVGIYAAILVSHGLVNTFGVRALKYFNNSSIILHSLGISALAIAVLAKAPTHQPASFVFGKFVDATGPDGGLGWSVRASPAYVAVIGILTSQYTITGFDASAHMSEETTNAAKSAPIGVIMSLGCSFVFGFFVILALLFSIQDFEKTRQAEQPVLQILLELFGEKGAVVLFTLILVCVWHCGLFCLTSNSRMMYAFSRDRGIPRFFAKVDERFQSPVRTVWLAALLSFCLALPSLGSSVAFSAATSIATVGLYISYSLPVLVGLIFPDYFQKGPFNLGRIPSKIVAVLCCGWVAFITIVFCLPPQTPVTTETLNYTPVCVAIVGGGAIFAWLVSARKWFTGPVHLGEIINGVNRDPIEATPQKV